MKLAKKRVKSDTRGSKSSKRVDMRDKDKPFVKGYAPIRRILERGSRYTRSCYNCDFFYQAPGDDEEVCQNENVLKYDMVVTESGIYCNQWKLCARRTDAKSLFRKGGKRSG